MTHVSEIYLYLQDYMKPDAAKAMLLAINPEWFGWVVGGSPKRNTG
jgi:hypothetical protein